METHGRIGIKKINKKHEDLGKKQFIGTMVKLLNNSAVVTLSIANVMNTSEKTVIN
ncbi:hypothetical protein [Enterococcus casseliflavus]|uniref:hypothetical protein n=1 Tax=Enterococcus casseliflavus TaxID=37734 RepID=UPI0008DEC1C4|nr:hypothetical protein [Enterococcus casseliflavus]SFE56641.1 hypothetical protein SAMN04487887_1173 [Enterococcus casseliflavus]